MIGLMMLAEALNLANSYPERVLTDKMILDYQAALFDNLAKAVLMGKHVVLGKLHGATVVSDYPCSDLCPAYTTRIIHFRDIDNLACRTVGGVIRIIVTPSGIAANPKEYCVPSVLGTERVPLGH